MVKEESNLQELFKTNQKQTIGATKQNETHNNKTQMRKSIKSNRQRIQDAGMPSLQDKERFYRNKREQNKTNLERELGSKMGNLYRISFLCIFYLSFNS